MITTKLLKYIFRGMIKGVEDYEEDLKNSHMDETGSLAQIVKPEEDAPKEPGKESPGKMRAALKVPEKKVDPSTDLSIEDILKEIK